MPLGKEPSERSVSGEFEDSDAETNRDYAREGSNPPGKPGRKKNPNSQAARRDQNRIAQREFRLRKQQRIRDLEARVEILSGGQDEALGEMRNMLKDLMAENHTLRGLLKSLAGFIGEGAGGLLPRLGWDLSDFNTFINRSETDTAWEGYQRRKKHPGDTPSQGQKRPLEEDTLGLRPKKPRNSDTIGDRTQNGLSLLSPMTTSPISINGLYSASSRPPDSLGGPSQPYVGSSVTNYPPPYVPGISLNMDPALQPISYPPTPSSASVPPSIAGLPSQQQSQAALENLDDENDPNKAEAYKLIRYHLENFKRNNQYCLPASLRPSLIQRSVPHESVIDGIPHPELRDRMILMRARYDLVECLLDYRRAVTIHGDDVLAHTNWEIGEEFLRGYGFLIEKPILTICNRWRRERGEPELHLSDIGGADQTSPQ